MKFWEIDGDTEFYEVIEDQNDLAMIQNMGWRNGQFLGQGGFGAVFMTYNKEFTYAVKYQTFNDDDEQDENDESDSKFIHRYETAHINRIFDTEMINKHATMIRHEERFILELKSLINLNHPCIVKIHNIFSLRNGDCLIFMEYCPGGDLADIIEKKSKIHEDAILKVKEKRKAKGFDIVNFYVDHPSFFIGELQASRYYVQIAHALKYCHSRGMAHKDIKPHNILLDEYRTICKLCDFGLVKNLFNTRGASKLLKYDPAGTPNYAAPETWEPSYSARNKLDYTKFDVWSMGVTLHQMCNGSEMNVPFHRNFLAGKYPTLKIRTESINKLINNVKFRNTQLSHNAIRFIARHFEFIPSKRPSFAELLQDPFLDQAASFIPELFDNTREFQSVSLSTGSEKEPPSESGSSW